jgi:hypothetical protein
MPSGVVLFKQRRSYFYKYRNVLHTHKLHCKGSNPVERLFISYKVETAPIIFVFCPIYHYNDYCKYTHVADSIAIYACLHPFSILPYAQPQ